MVVGDTNECYDHHDEREGEEHTQCQFLLYPYLGPPQNYHGNANDCRYDQFNANNVVNEGNYS